MGRQGYHLGNPGLAAKHGWPAFIHAFTPPTPAGTEPLKHFTAHFTKYRDALEAAGRNLTTAEDLPKIGLGALREGQVEGERLTTLPGAS